MNLVLINILLSTIICVILFIFIHYKLEYFYTYTLPSNIPTSIIAYENVLMDKKKQEITFRKEKEMNNFIKDTDKKLKQINLKIKTLQF